MRIISLVYFFLLVYIIAAILFWTKTLNKQNELIVRNEIEALNLQMLITILKKEKTQGSVSIWQSVLPFWRSF